MRSKDNMKGKDDKGKDDRNPILIENGSKKITLKLYSHIKENLRKPNTLRGVDSPKMSILCLSQTPLCNCVYNLFSNKLCPPNNLIISQIVPC